MKQIIEQRQRLLAGRVQPLTKAQRAKIVTIDPDHPPPFVRVGNTKLGHEIGNLKTPGISQWIVRHDWGAAAGIFNRRLAPFSSGPEPRHLVAQLHNIEGDIYRDPAIDDRKPLHDALRSELTDLFLDSAIIMCSRVLKQSGYDIATLRMRFEHPGQLESDRDGNWHVDGDGFRLFFTTEHSGLYMADHVQVAQAGFDFEACDDWRVGPNLYPSHLIEAGVAVYTHGAGVPIINRGTSMRDLGPSSWHAPYDLPEESGVVRPLFSVDFKKWKPKP